MNLPALGKFKQQHISEAADYISELNKRSINRKPIMVKLYI
jgi:hypothetical protein